MKQASTLDRDITQASGEPSADSRKQAAKFRILLSRLQAKADTLDPAGRMRLAGKMAGMMHKLELLRQASHDTEISKRPKAGTHRSQRNRASLPSAGSTIRGHVTDADTGRAITQGVVNIYDTDTSWITSASINVFGNYSATGLSAGTYYARATTDGYVSEFYDNYPCLTDWCDSPTPVSVDGSNTASGIDFALTRAGAIAGSVTDSVTQGPIDAQIEIVDELGDFIGYGYTDASGAYSVEGLPAGQYYAGTVTDSIYIDEIYDGLSWSGYSYTDLLSGTPITVTASQTSQVDFPLDVGGSISGTLTDATTSLPVEGGVVQIYDVNGDYASYGISDSEGHYHAAGLLAGTYHALMAYATGDYLPMLYPDIDCDTGCDPALGTPISVTAPQDTGGIDFAVTLGGRIAGTVTDAGTGLPLDYAYIEIFNSQAERVGMSYTYPDSTGTYESWQAFRPGSYFTRASMSGYVSELHGDIPCPWDQCDPLTATPVAVSRGAITTGIDFALSHGTGSISGTITDAASGQPLADMLVSVYNPFSRYSIGGAVTDSSGHYTAPWLPAGPYFVEASGSGHLRQLYTGIACPFEACDPTTGAAVVVQDGMDTPGINFSLGAAGFIHGIATDGRDGSPIQDVLVDIFDSSGNHVTYQYTDSIGSYTVDGLPDGNYYARAYGMGFYAVELYDNIPCFDESCNPLDGTPIPVSSAQSAANVNFSMLPVAGIRGIVKDKQTGAALANFTVKVLNPDGSIALTTQTGPHGIYGAYGFPAGSYYVIVEGGADYADQLYNGISCPDTGCNLALGTLVTVQDWRTVSPINFKMTDGSFLFSDEFEDGVLATDWTYTGVWSESQGSLIADASQKKKSAFAEPAFSGCNLCSLDLNVEITAGTAGKIWIIGWHNGKNQIELLMREDKNRWILKERVNGAIIQKVKGIKPIVAGTAYDVRMTYDGSLIRVFVDDPATALITLTPHAPPFGTAGFAAKYVTASFGYIHIE